MIKTLLKSGALTICALSLATPVSAAREKLVFALDLVRHGDRSPYEDLPTAPHTFSEGNGELTATGMQQEYQLGVKLRQRYVDSEHLLPESYRAGSIYVRSTDYDRTLMSAQSFLAGLYPAGTGPMLHPGTPALPNAIQPIPVHTINAEQDSALLVDIGSEKISRLMKQYVFASAEWKAKSAELSSQFRRWSQLTGMKVSSMFDVINLSDTLRAYTTHDIPLPAGLTTEEANDIIADGDWIYAALLKPTTIGDAAGKPALRKIIQYIQQAADKKSDVKYTFISAHDVTTMSVLSALHAPLNATPTYAADLNFALYEYGANNYVVKVTYNDTPVIIPGCNNSNTCTLEQFTNLG